MVKITEKNISDLSLYKKNPRVHDGAVDRMAQVIQEFGFRVPILTKKDGEIIDGHLRVKAALSLGMKKVPTIEVEDLSDAQMRALRLAANKSATFATWDFNLLAEEFESLQIEEVDMEISGFDPAEIDEVFRLLSDKAGDDASVITGLTKNSASVKVVLPVDVLKIFESTLVKTGEANRAEAVKKICEAYRGEKR